MQDNEDEERNDSGGEDGWKKKGDDAAAAADALDLDEARSTIKIIVPTKTEDGGSSNQEQADLNINQNEGQDQEQETTSARPDAFTTYSDDDTRMLTLLGLGPSANPNDGEQDDWRQLTGFGGLGRRINEDEDGNGTTPRKTRLSVELHLNAFVNMWIERGELDLNDDDAGHGQPPRQQDQDEDQVE